MLRRNPDTIAIAVLMLVFGVFGTIEYVAQRVTHLGDAERRVQLLGERVESAGQRFESAGERIAAKVDAAAQRIDRKMNEAAAKIERRVNR